MLLHLNHKHLERRQILMVQFQLRTILQTFNQFNNQPFTQNASNPMPIGNPMGQSSVLNPTQLGTFSPGLPPIEVGQQAIQQQPILRNPTPPPGWNDPPALKSRVVS